MNGPRRFHRCQHDPCDITNKFQIHLTLKYRSYGDGPFWEKARSKTGLNLSYNTILKGLCRKQKFIAAINCLH